MVFRFRYHTCTHTPTQNTQRRKEKIAERITTKEEKIKVGMPVLINGKPEKI